MIDFNEHTVEAAFEYAARQQKKKQKEHEYLHSHKHAAVEDDDTEDDIFPTIQPSMSLTDAKDILIREGALSSGSTNHITRPYGTLYTSQPTITSSPSATSRSSLSSFDSTLYNKSLTSLQKDVQSYEKMLKMSKLPDGGHKIKHKLEQIKQMIEIKEKEQKELDDLQDQLHGVSFKEQQEQKEKNLGRAGLAITHLPSANVLNNTLQQQQSIDLNSKFRNRIPTKVLEKQQAA